MLGNVWLLLSPRERMTLLDALAVIRATGRIHVDEVDALTLKLVHTQPHPDITAGVGGGQVEWIRGNRFPIRVCDYDIDGIEPLDVDEFGRACRIWFEPADEEQMK